MIPTLSSTKRRRLVSVGALLVGVLAASCSGDGGVGPRGIAGYYRLASVSGHSITNPGLFLFERGDLVLRNDGTFAYGIVCTGCGDWRTGSYRASGSDELRLMVDGSGATPVEWLARIDGDSLTVQVPIQFQSMPAPYVFRRASPPNPTVRSGLFVLATVNGRGAPFIVLDVTDAGARTVWTVPYDSITLADDLFFERHRADSSIRYVPGDSLYGRQEFRARGVYETGGGRLFLRYFSRNSPGRFGRHQPADSLAIDGNALVGRTDLVTGAFEERYTRR